ncbi:hypothetical protein [Polaromonas sp.]
MQFPQLLAEVAAVAAARQVHAQLPLLEYPQGLVLRQQQQLSDFAA